MENLQKSVNDSGIYKITNLITGDFYIGSAVKFKSRFYGHKYHLRNQKHNNKYLQRAWNKYEEKNFKFEILATCPKEYLLKLEQWFIDTQKPKYNLTPTAGSLLGYRMPRRSSLTENQIIDILKSYSKYSVSDIALIYNIKESTIKSLLFRDKVAQDIKKKINYFKPIERKPIQGDNNKQQRFTIEEINKIAELHNGGIKPIDIAKKLFNNESLRFAITKLVKGISYKKYYYLFENKDYFNKKGNLSNETVLQIREKLKSQTAKEVSGLFNIPIYTIKAIKQNLIYKYIN